MVMILYPVLFFVVGVALMAFAAHDVLKKVGLAWMCVGSFFMCYMLMSKGIHLP
jgi:Na+/phosphate symporter